MLDGTRMARKNQVFCSVGMTRKGLKLDDTWTTRKNQAFCSAGVDWNHPMSKQPRKR